MGSLWTSASCSLTVWGHLSQPLADVLQSKAKEAKQITTIEQWVVCFNAFISVMVLQHPHRARDLLAYSSTITKAAHDYEGKPWLAYDVHFRTLAATMQLQSWAQVDQSLWSQHFNRAVVRCEVGNPLTVGPYQLADTEEKGLREKSGGPIKKGKERVVPYHQAARNPICKKYNTDGCRSTTCSYRHICLSCHGTHPETKCSGSSSREATKPFRREAANS